MATRHEFRLIDVGDLHDRTLIELALDNAGAAGYRVAGVLNLVPEVYVIMEREAQRTPTTPVD